MTTYRVGNHHGVTICRDDQYIGVCFDPADAALIVEALNEIDRVHGPVRPIIIQPPTPLTPAEYDEIKARFMNNPNRVLTVLPPTLDVDHTGGAAEALAHVRRQLDAWIGLHGDGECLGSATVRGMLRVAAAELGVDEHDRADPGLDPDVTHICPRCNSEYASEITAAHCCKPAFRAEPAKWCPDCNHQAHLHPDEDRPGAPSCIGTGPGYACPCTSTCQQINRRADERKAGQ